MCHLVLGFIVEVVFVAKLVVGLEGGSGGMLVKGGDGCCG